METKKILGLDIGSNSIGAALITIPRSIDDFGIQGSIEWLGSRIIPVDGDYLQKFESGSGGKTKAAARRIKRGSRRLKYRYKLRRSRLIKIFKILGWIPEDFPLDDPMEIKNAIRETGKFSFRMSDYIPISDGTYKEFYKQFGYDASSIDAIVEEIKYRRQHHGKKRNENIKLLPEDWVVYYLRKKALTDLVTTNELVRIIYLMNQRRGFKSSRKDLQDENVKEKKWVEILRIESVEEIKENGPKRKDGKLTFKVKAGKYEWKIHRKKKPEWEGKEYKFLFTEKNGKLNDAPKVPEEKDWELLMVALDNQIGDKTPGAFFWDKLVETKGNYKIRQQTVRREKYKNELETIWKKQCEINPELNRLNNDKEILKKCAEALYPTQAKFNGPKFKEITANDLLYLISKDIIYYQRDLKSQKNLISECRYEKHKGIDGEYYGVKCAPVSSPEFQEFRIWQDIHNIRIFEKEQKINGTVKIDADVTKNFINENVKEKLFELFDSYGKISEKDIFKLINKHHQLTGNNQLNKDKYRINLFASRDQLPGNETKEIFRKIFRKHNYKKEGEDLLMNKDTFYHLWHILYSITSSDIDKSSKGIRTALSKFNLPDSIIEAFTKVPEFKKKYAAYSSKAIKKLLPLMRCGKYWKWENIHKETQDRIEKIIKDEWDFAYDRRTGELIREREFAEKEQFKGLPVWLACYVVYGRHSERESDKKYTAQEIESLDVMKLIPNNSLRNPIVEQVVRETIYLVKDICNQYGQPDEIHIELGRELKKNAKEKERITQNNRRNLEEKLRIKKLLYELLNGSFEHYNEDGKKISDAFTVKPNPENPVDIKKFRIYKSCAAITSDEEKEHWDSLFKDGKKERIPTNKEIKKYALWLSQKCVSPYTGKIISLSKLFSEEYEVEHIIPEKKLKDDSLENLVICEKGVNKLKDNELAMVFIRNNSGRELTYEGKTYKILTIEDYISHCKKTFKGKKLKRLLAEEVPNDFVERQINDTRYITRKLGELLYPFAKEKEGLVYTIGSITSELKNEWGLNNIWKETVKPRFERLEKITNKQFIIPDEHDKNKFHYHVPEQPDLDIKRIDHRHHALDALIVAATTREHIRYLNSLNAVDTNEELQKVKRALVKGKIREYKLPWETFTKEAKDKLLELVVTFKSNNRIITKPHNKYEKWVYENGEWKKKEFEQEANQRWMAIRKSLFKEPLGIIWLKMIKQVKVKKAFEIEIDRQLIENNIEKRRTAPYIYDKQARQIIKDIIKRCNSSIYEKKSLLKEIDAYLKKNKKDKSYLLNNIHFEKIDIAYFVPYKKKQMALTKKDYVEKLTIKKMLNDFPYFETIGKQQFEQFDSEKQKLITQAGIKVSETKNMSDFNFLFLSHILEYNNNPKEAFSPEGIDYLNKKAKENPKIGKEIKSITRLDGEVDMEDKFNGGFYETDKGSNAFFIIYENKQTKERTEMYSLSAHKAIERIVQGKPIAEKREGYNTIILSPDDLVYVPTTDELEAIKQNKPEPIKWNDKKKIAERIYRMMSCSKKDCSFVQHHIAKPIIPYDRKKKRKGEIDWHDKSSKTMDGKTTISECCIKIAVDRLGNIRPISL